MKKIIITILIICILLSSCKSQNESLISSIPLEEETAQDNSADSKTSFDKTTVTSSPIASPTPTTTLTPTPTQTPTVIEEIEPVYVETVTKLDVDRSYLDTVISSYEFVFDNEYMYYINETSIVKRSLTNNEASIIYDGVYDNKYLSIQDGWLYLYTQGTGIIKVKTDGTETYTIRNVEASNVMTVGDDIYYYTTNILFFDYQYSLYKLNLSSNENILFRMCGIDAKYQDEYIYYTTYDGLSNDCNIYNLETESNEAYLCACYNLPIIVDDIAYYFFNGEYSTYGNYYLYTKNILSGERSIILVKGKNLVQYYNYLLFIDDNENLCAYNTKDGVINEIISFKNTTIKAVHGDTILISKISDSGITNIYSMDLTEGTDILKLFSYNTEYSELPEEDDLIPITEIDVNIDYDYGDFLIVDFSTTDTVTYNGIEYCIKYEYDNINRKTHNSFYDNTNQKTIVNDIMINDDVPALIIIDDNIIYTNFDNPGYLYLKNICTNQIEIFNTGKGVPIRFTPYYQYIIIDSYYKGYNFSYLLNEELNPVEQNPIYSIALNMETGEIIEVYNDILEYPEY